VQRSYSVAVITRDFEVASCGADVPETQVRTLVRPYDDVGYIYIYIYISFFSFQYGPRSGIVVVSVFGLTCT
jgi:hypothetical protein